MAIRWPVAALIALLSACGTHPAPDATVPWNSESPDSPPARNSPATLPPVTDEIMPGNVAPDEVPPYQGIAPYRSASPGLPPPKTLPVQAAPAPAPNFSPGLPPGPVTNYGTGGLQAPPGAPPNPPYAPGGLMQ
jgi:hypothetical protein